MYHDVSGRPMWEVQPTLYWRVKRIGVWRYERARFAQVQPGLFAIEYPTPPEVKEDDRKSESE